MSDGLSIGTLSGRIELEDQFSSKLDIVTGKLSALDAKFGGVGKRIIETAGGFLTAEVALEAVKGVVHLLTGELSELVVQGSHVADTEKNFDRMTKSAGLLGDALMTTLRQGTRGTVTDFELMQRVNKDLVAGLTLTDAQFGTLSKGAFAFSKIAHIDVASALDTMSNAMLTGRTRALALLTGKIDLQAAEEKFAASLGVTTEQLSSTGKLEAARVAILDAVTAATNRVGEQTVSLADRLVQARTQWTNFQEHLGKTIATSPAVLHAMDAIGGALTEVFGEEQERAINVIVTGVNAFARGVESAAPYITTVADYAKRFWDWLTRLNTEFSISDTVIAVVRSAFGYLRSAVEFTRDAVADAIKVWQESPVWLREMAKSAVLTGGAIAGIGLAASAVLGPGATLIDQLKDSLSVMANLAQTLPTLPGFFGNLAKAMVWVSDASMALIALDVAGWVTGARAAIATYTAGIWGLNTALVGVTATLGVVTLTVAAVTATVVIGYQAWQLYHEHSARAAADARQLTVDQANLVRISQVAGREFKTLGEAEAWARQHALDLQAAQIAFAGPTETAVEALVHETAALGRATAASDKHGLVTGKLTEAQKAYQKAQEEVHTAGEGWWKTIDRMDQGVADYSKELLKAGVSQESVTIYMGLAKGQAEALKKALEIETSVEVEGREEVAAAWRKWRDTQMRLNNEVEEAYLKNHSIMADSADHLKESQMKAMLSSVDYQIAQVQRWQDFAEGEIDYTQENWVDAYQAIAAEAHDRIEAIRSDEAARLAGLEQGHNFSSAFIDALDDLPKLLEQAFTGGGDLGGAFKALGAKIGANLGKSLGEGLVNSGVTDTLASKIGITSAEGASKVASVVTGVISGGMSAAIGAGVGLIGKGLSALFHIGGPSKEELEARSSMGEIAKQIQQIATQQQLAEARGEAWRLKNIEIRDAYLAVGRSEDEAMRATERLNAATHNSKEAVQDAWGSIAEIMQQQKQDAADLDAAIRKYGFTIEELGPKMRAQQLSEQAVGIENDFRLLVGSGIGLNVVLDHMGSSINDFIQLAKRTGSEVPAEMRPVLDAMVTQGKLLDENGVAYTSLNAAGLTFSETMTQGFDRVVEALNRILEGLGMTSKALDGIPKYTDVTIRQHVEQDVATSGVISESSLQHFAGGGVVLPFTPRGEDTTPILTKPGELVLNEAQQLGLAQQLNSQPLTIINNIDARYASFDTPAGRTKLADRVSQSVMEQVRREKRLNAA